MIKAIPNKIVPVDDESAYMELIVDKASDLTSVTAVDGLKVAFGSHCMIIETGDVYYFDSSNEWVKPTPAAST